MLTTIASPIIKDIEKPRRKATSTLNKGITLNGGLDDLGIRILELKAEVAACRAVEYDLEAAQARLDLKHLQSQISRARQAAESAVKTE